ncbi:MAG TPA: hypothetical protein VMR81_04975 [Patescibacteria group bacterium]|nr:hypothetical protein [Patescibacteria group bacterium]
MLFALEQGKNIVSTVHTKNGDIPIFAVPPGVHLYFGARPKEPSLENRVSAAVTEMDEKLHPSPEPLDKPATRDDVRKSVVLYEAARRIVDLDDMK